MLRKKQEINEKLLNIQQSVNIIYHLAMDQIENDSNLWQDEEKVQEHLMIMKELMKTTAEYTDGAVTVYYRLDPSLQDTKAGVWLVRDEAGVFKEQELTDIKLYDKEDIGHVGWYYIPIEKGTETWINPYHNENMDIEMISYTIPVFQEGKAIGVVGMDITTELLYENAESVAIYDTGYAFLVDNEGNFVYHPKMLEYGGMLSDRENFEYLFETSLRSVENKSVEYYQWDGASKMLTTQKLCNGMLFTVCVTEEEIMRPQNQMLIRSILMIGCIVLIFIIATIKLAQVIVRLAQTDSLTGLRNKSAYKEAVDIIEKKLLNEEEVNFAVMVIDINDLKNVNDTFGHERGDIMIQNAANIIKKLWGNKATYRIGGDEFAVIFYDCTLERVQEEALRLEIEQEDFRKKNITDEVVLQLAAGTAMFGETSDHEYADVFRRADNAMYEDKKRKKRKGKGTL